MTHRVKSKVFSKKLNGFALLDRMFMDPESQEVYAIIVNLTPRKESDSIYVFDCIVPITDLDDWKKHTTD